MPASPDTPTATITDGPALLALYTGPEQPTHGNAGDWWLPHYPANTHPHQHDGTVWELAAPDAPHVAMTRRRDLIALVFAAITAGADHTDHPSTVAA